MCERELQGKHDKFIRWCFDHKDVLIAFCEWFLPPEVLALVDLSGIRVEKDSFIDDELKESFSDILVELPLKEGIEDAPRVAQIYLLIEHKSASERLSVFQVLRYMTRIWEREERNTKEKAGFLFSPIFPVILHHGRTEFKEPLQFQELVASVPGMEDLIPKFRPRLIDLNMISGDELPKDNPRLYSALAALQTVFEKELSLAFQDSLRQLAAICDDPGMQEFIDMVLKYITTNAREMDQKKNRAVLAEIKNKKGEPIMATIAESWKADLKEELREQVKEEVKEQVKEEVKEQVKEEVKEQVKEEVKEQVKEEVKEQVKEEVKEQVKEEVAVEFLAKGKAEGEAKGKASTILQIVGDRFSDVPDDIMGAVQEISDIGRLDSLVHHALRCQDLNEFRGVLQE